MDQVNALKVRNHLGEILDRLNSTGEPILISKGRQIRAVLVTPEQFQRRFLDCQTEEKKTEFLAGVQKLRRPKKEATDSVDALRELRGYK